MPELTLAGKSTESTEDAAQVQLAVEASAGKVTGRGRDKVARARGRVEVEARTPPRLARIRTDRCRVHPENQRDRGDLRELAASLETEGLEQPITVQDHGGWYEVVDGARRYLATVLAGRKMILAFIRPPRPDDEVLLAMLGTDVHKKPMTPVERGTRVERLRDEYGLTVADCAAYLGVSVSTVYNWARQAREEDHARGSGSAAVTTPRSGAQTGDGGRRPGRSGPVWKAKVAALRERWEDAVGEDGLARKEALALLAELAELAGEVPPDGSPL